MGNISHTISQRIPIFSRLGKEEERTEKCAEDEQEGRGKGVGAREGNERGKEGRGKEKKRFLKLIVSSPRSGPKIRLMKPSPPPWIVPSETAKKWEFYGENMGILYGNFSILDFLENSHIMGILKSQ